MQGVGFRPFVLRLARTNTLAGWVLNGEEGVEIFLEGAEGSLDSFLTELRSSPPPAAKITEIEVSPSKPAGFEDFVIRESTRNSDPTTGMSPDLAVCADCLRELFDPADPRFGYPYVNCTNCGPRYSVTLSLPYDRHNTTMQAWPLDSLCEQQYRDTANRRFHAQPVACASCGPNYYLSVGDDILAGNNRSIRKCAELLAAGQIIAVKGLGGYHLACDAKNTAAVGTLRMRKYRKEKPFALMARDLDVARSLAVLTPEAEKLLTSAARPIVIAPARISLDEVAPGSTELGVMLPYAPLHHLLFAAGAPDVLVMTSANRSSEPIAYEDADALERLASIADAFLIGERPIARRVDDSVVRDGVFGPAVLRRSRGYAPGAVATIPCDRQILALGADLKNTVALVVSGQAFVSQHIGDLADYQSFRAFQETIEDLLTMYEVNRSSLLVVSDRHPGYASGAHAETFVDSEQLTIQHHRAHIASVLAERGEWERRVIGVSLDGTGYGDDGAIWGGEILTGSIVDGFERVAHLRRSILPGGDAAAQYPVQAAAGFLVQLDSLPDLSAPPFCFSQRYADAQALIRSGVRSFATSSVGRLFDAAAALLGFTRDVTFEGQAAIWLEHLARSVCNTDAYSFPFAGSELDFRPLLRSVINDRVNERPVAEIARAFHRGLARGLSQAVDAVSEMYDVDIAVLSGGVFQNELLLEDFKIALSRRTIWTNHNVPANDGGISLGQAALAAFHHFDSPSHGTRHA